MLDNLNTDLFSLINASATASAQMLGFARFVAEKLLFAEALLMILGWLFGGRDLRRALVAAGATVVIAVLINRTIGALWFHARPFAQGVGNQFLDHAPDSSFPSDHGTLMFAVAFGLLLAKGGRLAGWAALIAAVLVAWSRVYLGVHWPLDMAASVVLSLLVALGVARGMKCVTQALSDRAGRWLSRMLSR